MEYDNVDCWLNACVAGVQAGSSLMYGYQLDYNRWLANTAHKYGMAAALKVSESSMPCWPRGGGFCSGGWGGGGLGGGGGGAPPVGMNDCVSE